MDKIATIHCGFQSIKGLEFNPDPMKDGKLLIPDDPEKSHLFNVREVVYRNGQIQILAECMRSLSVRADPYKITFDLDSNRIVTSGRCSCCAGIDAKCKHASALYQYINIERTESKTDEPKLWQKPSQKQKNFYRKAKTMSELFKCEPFEHDYKPEKEKVDELTELLEKFDLQGKFS